MKQKKFAIPEYVHAEDIKRIRKLLGLKQAEFAALTGTAKSTIERWETTEQKITGPIVLLLKMLEHDPEYMENLIIPEKKLPLRLKYMHHDTLCTIIDVDELRRKVQIKNYAENIMFWAFGNNLRPSYEDYLEFLESRCFPKTRDKMKLILQDLGLPFYDPFLIIQKTRGRMAEDDFWIEIER